MSAHAGLDVLAREGGGEGGPVARIARDVAVEPPLPIDGAQSLAEVCADDALLHPAKGQSYYVIGYKLRSRKKTTSVFFSMMPLQVQYSQYAI